MIIQFEANKQEAKQILDAIKNNAELEKIYTLIADSITNADDSQDGEVPNAADNAFIKRSE